MRSVRITLLLIVVLIPEVVASSGKGGVNYKTIRALGWTIRINKDFYSGDTSLLRKSFNLFAEELTAINDVLPKKALETLYGVEFWFEDESKLSGAAGAYT